MDREMTTIPVDGSGDCRPDPLLAEPDRARFPNALPNEVMTPVAMVELPITRMQDENDDDEGGRGGAGDSGTGIATRTKPKACSGFCC